MATLCRGVNLAVLLLGVGLRPGSSAEVAAAAPIAPCPTSPPALEPAPPPTGPAPQPDPEPGPEPDAGTVPHPVVKPTPHPAPHPAPPPALAGCASPWGQCGGSAKGKAWAGATCCPSEYECKKVNDMYSQCKPAGGHGDGPGEESPGAGQPAPALTAAPTPPPTPALAAPTPLPTPALAAPAPPPPALTGCADRWGQCGGFVSGKAWAGATCCPVEYQCVKVNGFYSQCKPTSSLAQVEEHHHAVSTDARGRLFGGPRKLMTALSSEEPHETRVGR
eukprot:CAMPEP_0204582142 /NCGR_PEP_ID=MMETSP0661-20131031/45047_1 /ASSEMBLY_ACC=CAM_ASM_000606 /TAXON_ID=109239 /ORGANISM="Alexandrium margalefi, Strain AMGDE01CS-322" /LENGTH=276 /DNA_ID=CAMNT_0051591395 /DNA_START=62 /DNA_END=892 /DNA_ORIENTATION=+